MSEPISGELPTDRAASAFATGQLLSKYGLLGFLVANALVVSVLSPAFLKPENIANVLTQAAPLGIVVLGQTFVLLVGGVDLSVASVMATSAVIATGFAATDNRMVPVIFAAAIGLGLVVGLVNGFLVAKRNVSPFLATLATTIVLQGLRFLYTQGSTGSTLPSAFALMGAGRFLGVPVNLIALVVLAAILGFVLLVSKYGRKIYLVGSNVRGAILVGLPTDRIIIGCYALCSVIAAIAGLFLVGYVGQVDQWTGKGYELDSIVAAVMGGVAITGGRGNVFGALLGVLILVVMFNAVILLGLPVQVQLILKGVIVIAASAFYLSGSWGADLTGGWRRATTARHRRKRRNDMAKKIAVLGTGANGAAIGADLTRAGLDVVLIDQWPENVAALRERGARIEMPGEVLTVPVRAFNLCDVCTFTERFDIVLMLVKAYDSRWAAQLIEPYLESDGLLVGVQNGMTTQSRSPTSSAATRTLGCVIEISSSMMVPGISVRDSNHARSWFAVGPNQPETKGRAEEIAELLRHAGKVSVVDNVQATKWMKLVSNATTLVSTALFGLSIHEGAASPEGRDLMLRSGQEALDVGQAIGHPVLPIFGLTESDVAHSNRVVDLLLDTLLKGLHAADHQDDRPSGLDEGAAQRSERP